MQQDGRSPPLVGLHKGRHLARVQGIDAGIVVSGEEHDRGILPPGLHILVGRVFEEVGEILCLLRAAVLGGPEPAHSNF